MIKVTRDFSSLSEAELKKRLFNTLTTITVIVFSIILLFTLFGTQVGAVFGFLSKHRNEGGGIFKQAVGPPIFTEIPKAVNNNKTNMKGYANTGDTVKLYVNGPETATTTAGQNGEFTFTDVELIKGRNSVFAKATDAQANESEKSETHTIVYDNDKPKLEIASPQKAEVVKNLNNRVQIKGTVNEKATININEKFVAQKPDFSFDYLLGVQEGKIEIKIKATDEAGNQAEETIFVTYVQSGN